MNYIKQCRLNDGTSLPSIAFETVNVKVVHGLNDVLTAIEAGYKPIDVNEL